MKEDDIKNARLKAGITQLEAANLVHVNLRTWQKWEYGERSIHPAFYELFIIKTTPLVRASGV